MINLTQIAIKACAESLKTGYRDTFGGEKAEYAEIICEVAQLALTHISHSDALYHDVEHTILVALVGQEILRGKQKCEGNVTCEDWLHVIVSLLCHDIGYVKGVCLEDRVNERCYTTATPQGTIHLPAGATDASLTPYHVDRGKQFIAECFANHPLLNIQVVQEYIELTRFPVPKGERHQDTVNYPGLARAADLIGQLSDPQYLQKLPALFYEFEENGTNKCLGYTNPGELRAGYPTFFWKVVYQYIQPALNYLEETERGQEIIAQLYRNVVVVEQELQQAASSVEVDSSNSSRQQPQLQANSLQGQWLKLSYPSQALRLK